MSKSIVIFGKGKSLLRCSKELVDEYEDIAICNYPVLNNDFNKLINGRIIKYHFANCGTFDDRYTDYINEKLGIQHIINTNIATTTNYKNYIKNKLLFSENIREYYEKYFKENYDGLDPSTGIMALQYILDLNKYDKIMLVGFDNFRKGEPMYYYNITKLNNKMKYLIGQNVITKDGELNIVSGHNPDKTEKYLYNIVEKYNNIQFKFISNMTPNYNYNNLQIF